MVILSGAHKELNIPQEWRDMVPPCVRSMRTQIEDELKAAMQYMAMGAYFSQDTVNRPGFADLFFKAASEEREHGIKLIHYLLQRGELTTKVSELIKRNVSFTRNISELFFVFIFYRRLPPFLILLLFAIQLY